MGKYDTETIMQNLTKVLQPFSDIGNKFQKLAVDPKFKRMVERTTLAIQNHEKTAPHIEKCF